MKLTGSYEIKLNKQLVWEALNNSEILKKAIPGCEEFTKNSDTKFTAKATNKIGPFAVYLDVKNLRMHYQVIFHLRQLIMLIFQAKDLILISMLQLNIEPI